MYPGWSVLLYYWSLPIQKKTELGASPYLQHIVAQTPVMETTRARGLCMVGFLSSTPTTHKYTDTEDAYAGSMSIDIHVKWILNYVH